MATWGYIIMVEDTEIAWERTSVETRIETRVMFKVSSRNYK